MLKRVPSGLTAEILSAHRNFTFDANDQDDVSVVGVFDGIPVFIGDGNETVDPEFCLLVSTIDDTTYYIGMNAVRACVLELDRRRKVDALKSKKPKK